VPYSAKPNVIAASVLLLPTLAFLLLMPREGDRWRLAKAIGTPDAYGDFLRQYPESAHAAEAKREIERQAESIRANAAAIVRELQASMVSIPDGSFTMGATWGYPDERPSHTVSLSGFMMGKHPITQAQWMAVMGTNPSHFQGCPSCPVERVSWDDAQTFISKLNALTGQTYRLPTEAEWEYAAGGGSSGRTKWAGTDSRWSLGGYAWYSGNADSKTHPVGQKSPNRLGLYDMSGNVWEWCSDWYGPYTSGALTNPRRANSGSHRVLRGGSWSFIAYAVRVASRNLSYPDYRNINNGFRLVRPFSSR